MEREINVHRVEYHGRSYEGRNCKRILANLDRIEALAPPSVAMKSVLDCLRAFATVDKCVFGYELDPNYSEAIEKFKETHQQVLVNFQDKGYATKPHIVKHHVQQFVELKNEPLGRYQEEVVEASHSEFEKLYLRSGYKVNCKQSESFAGKLMRCVLHFNSFHH